MLRLGLALALIVSLAACHKQDRTVEYPCDDEGLTRVDLTCRNAPEGDDVMLTDAAWQVSLAAGPAAYHVHGPCHINWAWIIPNTRAVICGGHFELGEQAVAAIYGDEFDGMCPSCKGTN